MADHTEQKKCDGSGEIHGGTPVRHGGVGEYVEDCPGCDHPDCPNRKPERPDIDQADAAGLT
jgi:hypothetical protein